MFDIKSIMTAVSFFIAGILFITIVVKKIKLSDALSENDKHNKIIIFRIMGTILIVLAVVILLISNSK